MMYFYDSTGAPVCFSPDSSTLYFWNGEPAAYVQNNVVFTFIVHFSWYRGLSESNLPGWMIQIRKHRFPWPGLANSQRCALKHDVQLGYAIERKAKCRSGDSKRSESLRTGGNSNGNGNARHLLHKFFSLSCQTRNPRFLDLFFENDDVCDGLRCEFDEFNAADTPQKPLAGQSTQPCFAC